jgi:hypothetical protein
MTITLDNEFVLCDVRTEYKHNLHERQYSKRWYVIFYWRKNDLN